MTTSLPTISYNDDSWLDFIAKANNIIDALSSVVVTIDQPTTGDVKIVGSISANTGYINSLSGGYNGTSNTLTITSNVNITGQALAVPVISVNGTSISANTTTLNVQSIRNLSLGSSLITSNTVTVSGSTPTIVHEFPKGSYRSGKYTFAISSGANRSTCEILLVNDGANIAQATEYAILNTGGALGTFSANNSATTTRVYFNPNQTNNTVSFHATLVT